MSSLTGKTIAETYKDLLQVSNNNTGIDSTLRSVSDGEGTSACIQISETDFMVTGTTTLSGAVNVTGSIVATSITGDGAGLSNISYSQLAGKPVNVSEFVNDAGYLLPGEGGSWTTEADGTSIIYQNGNVTVGSLHENNNQLKVEGHDVAKIELATKSDSHTSKIFSQAKKIVIGGDADNVQIDQENKVLDIFGTKRSNFRTSGRFTVGANDWKSLLHATDGSIGSLSNVAHNSSAKGLVVSGNTAIVIPVRIPIDPNATYAVTARLKKLVDGGSTYIGVDTLKSDTTSLKTDSASSFNYGTASSSGLKIEDGTVTYTGTYKGFNASSASDKNKFDPGGELFDVVIICNYTGTGDLGTGETLIESVEVEKISHDHGAIYSGTVTADDFIKSDGTPVGGTDIWTENGSDIHYSTGKVGIGTDSPTSGLELEFPGSHAQVRLHNTSAGGSYFGLYASGDANSVGGGKLVFTDQDAVENRLVIDSNGNIGIGTADPAYKLSVEKNESGTNAYVGITSHPGNNAALLLGDTDNKSIGRVTYYNATDSMGFRTNNTDRLTIDSSGNVGIGTDSPSDKLEVAGNIKITGDDKFLKYDGGYFGIRMNDGGHAAAGINAADLLLRVPDDKKFHILGKEGSYLHVFTDDGNVGIGSTSPSGKLEVNTGSGVAYFTRTAGDDGSTNPALGIAADSTKPLLRAYGDGLVFETAAVGGTASERMRIDSTGKTGIGTNAPESPLHVVSQPGQNRTLKLDYNTTASNSSYTWQSFEQAGTEAWRVVGKNSSGVNDSLHFWNSNDNNVLVLNQAGNVGVGVVPTTAKLQVAGDLHIDGDISYTGTATVINAESLAVEDKNIILGEVASPTDITGNGGGLVLRAASDKTLTWSSDDDAWVSNVNLKVQGSGVNLHNPSGSAIYIAETDANSVAGIRSNTPTGDWFAGVGKVENDGFDIYDQSANASRIHIDPDGKVGIGVQNPDEELHVGGNAKIQGYARIEGDTHAERIFLDNSSDYPLIYFRDSSQSSIGWMGMRPDTTSQLAYPADQEFNIYAYDTGSSTTRKGISIEDDWSSGKMDMTLIDGSLHLRGSTGGRGRLTLQADSGSEWELYPKSDDIGIYNRTSGAYALKIGNNNNVRIGSAAANSYKLQVDGDTNISGSLETENLTVTGDIISSSQVRAKQNDTNLLPVYEWYDNIGSTSSGAMIASWTVNGNGPHEIKWIDHGPSDFVELAWETGPEPDGRDADGGWLTDKVEIDNTQLYRSTVMFKFTNFKDGVTDEDPNRQGTQHAGCIYHGTYGYNSATDTSPRILTRIDNNSTDANSYFSGCIHEGHGLEDGKWYLSVGYLHPHDGVTPANSQQSGIYDCVTGKKIYHGYDWRLTDTITHLRHRTYNYYDESDNNWSYFIRPRLEACNGTEPTLQELLDTGHSTGAITRHNFPNSVAIGKTVTDATVKVDINKKIGAHGSERSDPIIKAGIEFEYSSSSQFNSLDITSYGTTWGTSEGMDISSASGSLSLSTGDNTVMTLGSNKCVGIGTRDPQGNISSDNALHISDSSVAEIRLSSAINFSIYTGSQAFVIRDVGRSKDKIIINNASQYIGINTNSPSCPVHIRGLTQAEDLQDGDPYLDLLVESPDNHGGIGIDVKGGNQSHIRFLSDGVKKWQWRVPAHYSDSTALGYPNAETLRAYSWEADKDVLVLGQIAENLGGVGINTTPVHALDVVGDAHISGTLTASEVITNTQTNLNIVDKEINAAAGATTGAAMHLGGIKLGTGAEQKTWIYDKDISTNGSWVANTSIKCSDKLVVTDGSGPDDWLFPIDLTRSSGETNDGSNLWTAGGSPIIGMKNLQATDGNILGGLEFEGDNWYAGSIYCKATSHANRQAALRFATRGGNSSHADRMTITPTGNVGIGTTSPNANVEITSAGNTKLLVTPGTNSTDASIELGAEHTSGAEGFRIRYDNDVGDTYIENMWTASSGVKNAPAMRFRTQTVPGSNGSDTTDAMTISHIGNVGIGTISPAKKLHVYETDINEEAYFRLQHSGAKNSSLNISNSVSDWSWVADGASDRLFLYESGEGNRVSFPAGGGMEIPNILEVDSTHFTIEATNVHFGNKTNIDRYNDVSGSGGITVHADSSRASLTCSNNATTGWSNAYFNKINESSSSASNLHDAGNRWLSFAQNSHGWWDFRGVNNSDNETDFVINGSGNSGSFLFHNRPVGVQTYRPATDLQVGDASKTSDTIIRSVTSDGYKAGFEAIGDVQGTGYVYVGQSPDFGGGMFYNGDGTPSFASGEGVDRIGFYRRKGTEGNQQVFSYKYDSNDVYFEGNIGIGTPTPDQLLHLYDSSNNSARLRIENNEGHVDVGTDGTDAFVTTGGSEIIRFSSDGMVGIGTPSPGNALHIKTDDPGFGISSNDYSNIVYTGRRSASHHDAGYFRLRNEATTKVVLDSAGVSYFNGGDVGIGTNSPSAKLEVNGTFKSSSLWTTSSAVTHWGASGSAKGTLTWDTGYARVAAAGTDSLHLGKTNQVVIDQSNDSVDIVGDVNASGTVTGGIVAAGNGATGSFTSADGKTITVTDGIITNIA